MWRNWRSNLNPLRLLSKGLSYSLHKSSHDQGNNYNTRQEHFLSATKVCFVSFYFYQMHFISQVPRNKWNCPACNSKSPRGRRGRAKKPSESTTPSLTPSNTDSTNYEQQQQHENGSISTIVTNSLPVVAASPTNNAPPPTLTIKSNSPAMTPPNATPEQGVSSNLEAIIDQLLVPPVTISATPQGHQVTSASSTPNGTAAISQQTITRRPRKRNPWKR